MRERAGAHLAALTTLNYATAAAAAAKAKSKGSPPELAAFVGISGPYVGVSARASGEGWGGVAVWCSCLPDYEYEHNTMGVTVCVPVRVCKRVRGVLHATIKTPAYQMDSIIRQVWTRRRS